jgi:hypothetical protein
MAKERRNSAKLFAVLAILALLALFLVGANANALGIGGASIFLVLILMRLIGDAADKGIGRHLKGERRAIRGARAEEEVQDILSSLGEGYEVIYDVPSPFGNIDHVVLTRFGGLFLIETKSHWGTVEINAGNLAINGHPPEKDFIAQVLRNTYWLRDQITPLVGQKPWVTPLLVFTNAFVPYVPPIRGVVVLNKRYLCKRLVSAGKGNPNVWLRREAIGHTLTSQADSISIGPPRSREAA